MHVHLEAGSGRVVTTGTFAGWITRYTHTSLTVAFEDGDTPRVFRFDDGGHTAITFAELPALEAAEHNTTSKGERAQRPPRRPPAAKRPPAAQPLQCPAQGCRHSVQTANGLAQHIADASTTHTADAAGIAHRETHRALTDEALAPYDLRRCSKPQCMKPVPTRSNGHARCKIVTANVLRRDQPQITDAPADPAIEPYLAAVAALSPAEIEAMATCPPTQVKTTRMSRRQTDAVAPIYAGVLHHALHASSGEAYARPMP